MSDRVIMSGRRLSKTYASDRAAVRALENVDVDVHQGEFVAIMGPSGCGKSTLLQVLGTLDAPDEGEVVIDGVTVSSLSAGELARVRRRTVGFVFQFFNLVPVLSVEENVTLPAMLDRMPEEDLRPRLENVLSELGLEESRSKLPASLSGGEQQRAAIARAVINQPTVVLADEPTGNLDRVNGLEVLDLLKTLNGHGQTVVLVTHDVAVAAQSQRVLFMRDGRLIDEVSLDGIDDPGALLSRLAAVRV
jgi:ABC-type lipoprotein export system ATPase subunit